MGNSASPAKKKVLIVGSSQGHKSIAQAIDAALQPQYHTSLLVRDNQLLKPYRFLYRYSPKLFLIPYYFSMWAPITALVTRFFRRHYRKEFAELVEKEQPDAIISTYYPYSPVLNDLAHERGIPMISAITDPRTIHPLFLSSDFDCSLAFDQTTQKQARHFSRHARIETVGWFVRPEYVALSEKERLDLRRQLGLNPDVFTLLISSGSDGSNFALKALPALFTSKEPVQVFIACGSNKTMLLQMQTLTKLYEKHHHRVRLLPLGFRTDMHRYMQAADLVIGKAGPNTIFEAAATHTPFFAVSHISGQETGNLALIREYNLGYVEEDINKAARMIRQILDNPTELQQFQPDIQRLAEYNRQAPAQLRTLLSELME